MIRTISNLTIQVVNVMQLACLMFGFKPEKKHKGKFEIDKDGFFELSRLNLLANPN